MIGLKEDDRGVSEIMGEILMIGIVVISFGLVSSFVYGYFDGLDIPPVVNVKGIVDDDLDTIYIKHSGGDYIGEGELTLIVKINDVVNRYNQTEAWMIGDAIALNTSDEYGIDIIRGDEIEILLVHNPTGSIMTSGDLSYNSPNCQDDTTPPSGVTDLHNTTFESDYIIWAWDAPPEEDYSHLQVYINNEYKGTTSGKWYNATGLTPGVAHTIGTLTVDSCGNVNTAWVNDSADTYKSWWDKGWNYRKPITLSSQYDVIDYQIRLNVPYDSDMQPDFDDLRFTEEDDSPIPHWVEFKDDGNLACVWVKVPTVEVGNTTILMYYGNSSTTSQSSGSATFEFFDDFDAWVGWGDYGSGVVEWSSYGSEYILEKNGSCDPNGGWKSLGGSISNYRLITKERRDSSGSDCSMNRYGVEDSSYNGYGIYRTGYTSSNGNFGFERRTTGSGGSAQYITFGQPYDNWYVTELKRNGDTLNASLFSVDRNLIGSESGTDSTHTGPFDRVVIRGGRPYYIEWIALAKYSGSELSYIIGDEEVL
ncbi:MAG: DUF2341 domain-containing protein [Halobacteriota archaeon]|nr:DUF2341 domain-containing protein [Halobacteriota archaeon]